MFKADSVDIDELLLRLYKENMPAMEDIAQALSLTEETHLSALFGFADKAAKQFFGGRIFLRGVVEFSNRCDNSCGYCGLNRFNSKIKRYSLDKNEIINCVKKISKEGISTVVLQSGENRALDPQWLADIIKTIKQKFDLAVTLSVGEKSIDEYKLWKRSGADRYLLKIETTDRQVYENLHPGMSFTNRLSCLAHLRELGYETGTGNIIGLKNQTINSIAGDILFFKKYNFDMVAIGPFVPHCNTDLGGEPLGDSLLTLKAVAAARIVCKTPNIPATTALGSMDSALRLKALRSGANVIMPNFTPESCRSLYDIYPGRKFAGGSLDGLAKSIGLVVDYSKGSAKSAEKEYFEQLKN